MQVLLEFLKAFFIAGVPVGVVTYVLVWWALRSEYLDRTSDLKQFEMEVKRLKDERSGKKKNANTHAADTPIRKLNPVHNKWLKFGGGFYGIVALMTFVIIEVGEILGFLGGFRENIGRLSNFSLDMAINFAIDAFMNFIQALAWPWYWMSEINANVIWIWMLAAYAGYWLGAKASLSGLGLWGKRS